MHCIVRRAHGGATDDDNRTARATGQRPDRRSPRRHRLAIHVIGRAANALILGLVRSGLSDPRLLNFRFQMIL